MNVAKVRRFIVIYGVKRTLYKTISRLESIKVASIVRLFKLDVLKKSPTIGLIGAGQYGFSTIGFFLSARANFIWVLDKSEFRARLFSEFYRSISISNLRNARSVDVCCIASNHSTHASYLFQAIQLNLAKRYFIEKPIVVNWEDLRRIKDLKDIELYSGFNRPYSEACVEILSRLLNRDSSISIVSTISGHKISTDHWYREPAEGTRICGNLGHWIDFTVELFNSIVGGLDELQITFISADENEFDDNFVLVIKNSQGDISTVSLNSRIEPLNGIHEHIQVQSDKILANIEDFRVLKIQEQNTFSKFKYWPKDVGHKNSLKRLLQTEYDKNRWYREVLSAELTLRVLEMVRENKQNIKLKIEFNENYNTELI